MNVLWRAANRFYKSGGIQKKIGRSLELLNFIISSNAVSARATIGKGTIFHHHSLGCVIHEKSVIGDDCHIFQNVTIGSKWSNGVCEGDAPCIGNRVFIGAGAIILGKIAIGDDVIIGANAVVTKDIPNKSIAMGVPATIKMRKDMGDIGG